MKTIDKDIIKLAIELIQFGREKNVNSVHFQAIVVHNQKCMELLQFGQQELNKLNSIVEEIILLKREGYPVFNSYSELRGYVDYFRNPKLRPKTLGTCQVGYTNFVVHHGGDVYLCFNGFPPIGNLNSKSAKEIWQSKEAYELRKKIKSCQKPCMGVCVTPKSFIDKIRKFFYLVRV